MMHSLSADRAQPITEGCPKYMSQTN